MKHKNQLEELKYLMENQKTISISRLLPLVMGIEKMYLQTASKLSEKTREKQDSDIKLENAKRHILKLSAQLHNVHASKKEIDKIVKGKSKGWKKKKR